MVKNLVLSKIGYSNIVLIENGPNSAIVDTGAEGHLYKFKDLFHKHNLKPEDIKLIILTHTHNDHTGNLIELVKYTKAKVLIHKNEFENLKYGYIRIPDGLSYKTRIISKLGRLIVPRHTSPKPFSAQLINEDEFDLKEFGINGKVISTFGHTMGSQSVLIGNRLISGDTFINLPKGTIFPHFADDPRTLLITWQQLFDMGIEEIYPGHGKKIRVDQAFEEFRKWKKKFEI